MKTHNMKYKCFNIVYLKGVNHKLIKFNLILLKII